MSTADDLGLQADLFKAYRSGLQERGAALDDDARGWAAELADQLLASKQPAEVKAGAELVGQAKLDKAADKVGGAGRRHDRRRARQREAALDSADGHRPGQATSGLLGRVLADADAPVELREAAAKLLGQANQPETQAQLVAGVAGGAGPACRRPSPPAWPAAARAPRSCSTPSRPARRRPRLLQEKAVETPLTGGNIPGVKERLAKLTKGLPPADQKVQELLAARRGLRGGQGRRRGRGQGVREELLICHTLASKGAKVGPQLDGVGIRGLDRLLEDVLDPNRNVDQAFRLTILNLKDGKVVRGLLLREEGEVYVMADDKGKEVRVPKKEVDERSTSQLSPMPANFADQIPEADFNNLMAFLLKQTAKPAEPPKSENTGGK